MCCNPGDTGFRARCLEAWNYLEWGLPAQEPPIKQAFMNGADIAFMGPRLLGQGPAASCG